MKFPKLDLSKMNCLLMLLLITVIMYFLVTGDKMREGHSKTSVNKLLKKVQDQRQKALKKQLNSFTSTNEIMANLPSLIKQNQALDTLSKSMKLVGGGDFSTMFGSSDNDDNDDHDDNDDSDNGKSDWL